MYTPHRMTWYQAVKQGTETIWKRHEIPAVMWQDRKAENVIASGMQTADSATIYVPKVAYGQRRDYAFALGDYLVKGIVPDEINSTFRISNLQAKYTHVIKVTSVDEQDYGAINMQHWQIGGK